MRDQHKSQMRIQRGGPFFYLFLTFCLFGCTDDKLPTCYDGLQNGGETGIDCGGNCQPCSCFNGIKDENEDCADCGGECFPCPKVTGRYAEQVFFTSLHYPNRIFEEGVTEPYGQKVPLYLSFYEPEGDTATIRPLVILIGQTTYAANPDPSFFTDGIQYLEGLLAKGYLAASITGVRYWRERPPMSLETYNRTAMRIRADVRAAVRFFKKYADVLRIDTANIWLMGASQGAMAALHAAYIDQSDLSEIDPELVEHIMGDGGLEGSFSYRDQSSSVKGVIILSGMIFDVRMIDLGEPILISVMGGEDQYRPFDCEMVKVNWINEERMFCGPLAMETRMKEEGFRKEDYYFKTTDVPPADHYAPFDPLQCPECEQEIVDFLASKLGYCQ